MTTEQNPYVCLGLTPGSSQDEIKRRYRQLAKQFHPDRNTDTAACEEKLRTLNAAYAVLSDPIRKAAYGNPCGTLFSPAPALRRRAVPIHPQRSRRRRTAAGFGLVLLLSAGIGAFFTSSREAANLPPLSSLLPQSTLSSAGSAGADFSFIPSRSAFDDSNSTVPAMRSASSRSRH